MNPIFQAMLEATLFRKATCPKCRRDQLVTARKKKTGTRCKFCGNDIPPSNN